MKNKKIIFSIFIVLLAFVFIGGINATSIYYPVRERTLESLVTSTKNTTICFYDYKKDKCEIEARLEKGDSLIGDLVVNNNKKEALYYTIKIISISSPLNDNVENKNLSSWFLDSDRNFELPSGEYDIRPIRIKIPPDATQGIYYFNYSIIDGLTSKNYAHQTFSINIIGKNALQNYFQKILKWFKNLFIK